MEYVINKLFNLLAVLSEKRREDRQMADDAIRAISFALNETYIYYQRIEEGAPRDREKERFLFSTWSAAAIPIRHLDRDLAILCEKKSEYWLDPDGWSSHRIENADIGLESVRDKYRRLLEEK